MKEDPDLCPRNVRNLLGEHIGPLPCTL
jgi:hypothetical protein